MNIANKITVGRLLIGICYFMMIAVSPHINDAAYYFFAFSLFIIASLADILDGYLARKYNVETAFGRIADPLVDKIIICGSLVFFVAFEITRDIVQPWIVVVILGREFLVNAMRGYAESIGVKFEALSAGKLKTLLQSFAVGSILVYMAVSKLPSGNTAPFAKFVYFTSITLVYAMVIYVAYSAVIYVFEFQKRLAMANGGGSSTPKSSDETAVSDVGKPEN